MAGEKMSSPDAQKSRLGRGLASLIGERPHSDNANALSGVVGAGLNPIEKPAAIVNSPLALSNVIDPGGEGHRDLPVDVIKASPLNPRRDFPQSELDDLANSIRERGLVQPLVVRPSNTGNGYEIVAGERRWRACQIAQLHTIPVIIRRLDDKEMLEIAIIENVQRSDLNAIEEANGYHDLIESFGYLQEELSKIIGKSRSYLANVLRLLKLPLSIQDLLREGEISAGHARALIGVENGEEIALMIMDKGLSVRETEKLVKAQKEDKPLNIFTTKPKFVDVNIVTLEKELSDKLGLKVKIKQGKDESGELKVSYKTLDQFENLKSLLNK